MLYNGTYTVENIETHEHRTFEISTQPDDSTFAPGKRLVALLRGPDNDNDYQSFGFVNDNSVSVWRSKRGSNGKRSAYEYYAILLSRIELSPDTAEVVNATITMCNRTYSVKLSKRCLRCNRKLTTPESIERGIGPVCAKKSIAYEK